MTSAAASIIPSRDSYATARFNMVESQIRTNRVENPDLLAALAKIPREIFVPESLVSVAYVDRSLRAAPNRFLMEPLTLARLLQEAGVTATDKVLIIGAGSGYSAAIAAQLAATVTGVECDPDLAEKARANLTGLGIANASIETGVLTEGFPSAAPFDVILIDGMISELPAQISAQLAERGRLVTVQAQEGRCASGMLYRKLGGSISGRVLFDAAGAFLPGFAPQSGFAL
jgi:protein-L-isoaspartate(D-aspartate) O-methyltransferase